MTGKVWLPLDVILAIHEEQVAEHGGAEGVRDMTLVESALARPMKLAAYGEPDVPALAASLGYGLARNHLFVDGSKRTAFVAIETFLALNGVELTASDAECVVTVLDLAAGDLPEEALAAWLRDSTVPR